MEKIKRKLRKGVVTRRVKGIIEHHGGEFIKINWNKYSVHFLTPTKQKKVESLGLKFGIYQ